MIGELLLQFDLYTFLVILHIVGTAIGAGGATLSDILFFKSIEDGKISKQEFALMHAGGLAIWGGLALLVLSGVGMVAYQYIQGGELLFLTSSKIQAKLVIVSIIALNGLLLHLRVFPLFRKSLDQDVTRDLFLNHAGLIFTSGAVSATSWYTVMIVGAWRGLGAPTLVILAVYFTFLTGGVIVAQFVGKFKVAQIKKKLESSELQKSAPLSEERT